MKVKASGLRRDGETYVCSRCGCNSIREIVYINETLRHKEVRRKCECGNIVRIVCEKELPQMQMDKTHAHTMSMR
ncbi:MAG: hypothetical protein HFE45_03800 [Oscillospiraceae bacterium]|nr:hypothetical protein [Oscillospiraceae bacterium]